jgi:hypothetical protein
MKTKDYGKDTISLQNTNARLALTKRGIREAKLNFAKLQEDYSKLQSQRDMLRDRTNDATTEACKENNQKKASLEDKMMHQKQDNLTIERHLIHLINSAGLNEQKSNMLLSNLEEFIEDNDKETERLKLDIAHATKKYHDALEVKQQDLRKLGVPEEQVQALDVLLDSAG